MPSEYSSWRRMFSFAYNALGSGIPMPKKNSAIFGTGSNVTVGSDVTFRSGQTGHQAKMTKNNLNNFGGVSRENPVYNTLLYKTQN